MKKVTLHIENAGESEAVDLGAELTIGRTSQSQLVLQDQGLSRLNTTIFRDGDEVLVADENSLNGTFLNGRKLSGSPEELRDGDELRIGSHTRIRVRIASGEVAEPVREAAPVAEPFRPGPAIPPQAESAPANKPPLILIAAGLMTFAIIFFGMIAFVIFYNLDSSPPGKKDRPTPQIQRSSLIPVRVIDPLGGEDEEDLDDLIASWEVAEEEIVAENVADVTVAAENAEEAELNVSATLLADRQRKALEGRSGETGIRPAGLDVPKELYGDGVIKQKAKLRDMKGSGYRQPLDFAELAEKRLSRALIEMPMATQSFYLDVGGSASDGPFQSFSFAGGNADIAPGTPKFQTLANLASNFSGQKYDLNNPAHRKQMRIRLLRMFNQRAKPILKELSDEYFRRFGRPLRVTSLTRSMDYQISLNRNNPNSFKVRDENSLPPHTSGCAFDLARKHMTAEEQNFVMQTLARMERENKLDALIEYGANACFHVFIYEDGRPPRM